MNLIAERSISISVRQITRQMGHGILMGVLSIVAGVMLTLAVPGFYTNEYDESAQAAVVRQQNEAAPLDTDDFEAMLVVIRFHDRATSDNESHAISQPAADETDLIS